MSSEKFSLKMVKNTTDITLNFLEKSKHQMFIILEGAKKEQTQLHREEKLIQKGILHLVEEISKMEIEYKNYKLKLEEISNIFSDDNQSRIKELYEYTNKLQNILFRSRKKEKLLIKRKEELKLRVKEIEDTITQSESSVAQFGAVYDYLKGNLKQLDDVVENAEQRLQFGTRIIQAQEDERLRIAREIHDGPAQSMANLIVRAELVERVAMKDFSSLKEELKEFKQIVRDSVAEVRGIIYDLRPIVLEDLGLISSLQKYIDVYKEQFNLPIDFSVLENSNYRIESSIEIALFRILQESLTNIRKYANATKIKVSIEFIGNTIVMIIQDNGVGFNLSKETYKNNNSFGLIGMKERMALLNGELMIESKILEGTKVTAIVKLL